MTHAEIVRQYENLLVYAHRVWGQSRRYFGGVSFEEYTGYKRVKYRRNISQASINRLQAQIDRVRSREQKLLKKEVIYRQKTEAREETEAEIFIAELAIDNLMNMIEAAVLSASTTRGAIDIERTANFIRGRIADAVEDHGAPFVVERLTEWAADYEAKIQRLILAIYDPEYNTNAVAGRQDLAGNKGRSKFYRTISGLMEAIGATEWESVYPSELPR